MYRIQLSHQAAHDLQRIPKKVQERIYAALDAISENPFAGKKLHGDFEGMWSERIWPYRILYVIQKDKIIVTVLRIVHRQGAYKK